MSKQLGELMSAHCGLSSTPPDVPCDDISSYGIDIRHTDSVDFPTFPETADKAILR